MVNCRWIWTASPKARAAPTRLSELPHHDVAPVAVTGPSPYLVVSGHRVPCILPFRGRLKPHSGSLTSGTMDVAGGLSLPAMNGSPHFGTRLLKPPRSEIPPRLAFNHHYPSLFPPHHLTLLHALLASSLRRLRSSDKQAERLLPSTASWARIVPPLNA